MPPDTPVTIPVEPTVAIPVAPDDQVPPDVASLSVVVELVHREAVPVIAATPTVTLTDFVAVQPLLMV